MKMVQKCLQKNPQNRPTTKEILESDLFDELQNTNNLFNSSSSNSFSTNNDLVLLLKKELEEKEKEIQELKSRLKNINQK